MATSYPYNNNRCNQYRAPTPESSIGSAKIVASDIGRGKPQPPNKGKLSLSPLGKAVSTTSMLWKHQRPFTVSPLLTQL
jgi:hypothetical protein